MNRGDVWIAAGGPDYAGKPRSVVLVQSDRFDATLSVTICGLTTTAIDRPWARLRVTPTPANGLERPSWLMVDKLMTIPRRKLNHRIGQLGPDDTQRLSDALMVFLGLTERGRPGA